MSACISSSIKRLLLAVIGQAMEVAYFCQLFFLKLALLLIQYYLNL